jgi:hypothetical protein
MVRELLQKFYVKDKNVPRMYTGRLLDVSLFRGRDGYRVLISDVFLMTGEWITDHIWLRLEVLPQTMGLNMGDVIQFTGIVENYKKKNGSMDFGIVAVQESISKGVGAV